MFDRRAQNALRNVISFLVVCPRRDTMDELLDGQFSDTRKPTNCDRLIAPGYTNNSTYLCRVVFGEKFQLWSINDGFIAFWPKQARQSTKEAAFGFVFLDK